MMSDAVLPFNSEEMFVKAKPRATEKLNESEIRTLANGVSGAIVGLSNKLEDITRNMERDLPSLNVRRMPEYRAVVQAIINYAGALKNKVNEVYK